MEACRRICITLIPHIAEARDIALSLTSNMVHQMNDGHGREDKSMGNEVVDPTSPPVIVALPKAAVEITQCSHRKRRRDEWSVWKVCTSRIERVERCKRRLGIALPWIQNDLFHQYPNERLREALRDERRKANDALPCLALRQPFIPDTAVVLLVVPSRNANNAFLSTTKEINPARVENVYEVSMFFSRVHSSFLVHPFQRRCLSSF